jgi:hypothetical protein
MICVFKTSLLVCLLALSCIPATIAGQSQQGQPVIEVIRDKERLIKIEFTENDLTRVQAEPKYVLEKLSRNPHRVSCDGPRRRITDFIWVCRDGTRLRTTNATLLNALETIWGKG